MRHFLRLCFTILFSAIFTFSSIASANVSFVIPRLAGDLYGRNAVCDDGTYVISWSDDCQVAIPLPNSFVQYQPKDIEFAPPEIQQAQGEDLLAFFAYSDELKLAVQVWPYAMVDVTDFSDLSHSEVMDKLREYRMPNLTHGLESRELDIRSMQGAKYFITHGDYYDDTNSFVFRRQFACTVKNREYIRIQFIHLSKSDASMQNAEQILDSITYKVPGKWSILWQKVADSYIGKFLPFFILAALSIVLSVILVTRNIRKKRLSGNGLQKNAGAFDQTSANSSVFCRFCGAKIPGDSRFCTKCGASITET